MSILSGEPGAADPPVPPAAPDESHARWLRLADVAAEALFERIGDDDALFVTDEGLVSALTARVTKLEASAIISTSTMFALSSGLDAVVADDVTQDAAIKDLTARIVALESKVVSTSS